MKRYGLCCCFLFLALGLQAQNLNDNLLLYYPLNGDATDASGNDRDGTPVNILAAEDRFGDPIGAVAFPDSAFIDLPEEPALEPLAPVTISFWVYPENPVTEETIILTTDSGSDAAFGVFFTIDPNDQTLNFNYGDNCLSASTPPCNVSFQGTTSLALNTWTHVVGVLEGSRNLTLYLNGCVEEGVLRGSPELPIEYSDQPGTLGRGRNESDNTTFFDGRIDDFYYWDRALDAGEVAQLFDNFNLPELLAQGDTTACDGGTVALNANDSLFTDLVWSTGETTATIEVQDSGAYVVSALFDACLLVMDTAVVGFEFCPCDIQFPNAFTPNGDNVNESFGVLRTEESCFFETFELRIYNRWGDEIFNGSLEERWDGTIDGEPAPIDIYVYVAQYTVLRDGEAVTEMQSGDLSLVR